jgi:kinesin family protein 2/24
MTDSPTAELTQRTEAPRSGRLPSLTPPGHTPTSMRPPVRVRDDSLSRSSALDIMPSTSVDVLLEGSIDDAYVSDAPEDVLKKKANRIQVIVRKRPLNDKEGGEDCLTCEADQVHVNATKLRVDLTEYKETYQYVFDAACGRELITTVFEGGSASCFAYGQTGSGKTHTMMGGDIEPGLYVLAAEDIFARCQENHRVFVSLYEIYCNSLFDLLNQRSALHAREDANKRINICGLTWHEIKNVKDLLRVIDRGTLQRRTGSTSANEFSSRSHAVMTISLRDEDQPKFFGCLNVVDLAGSERAADTAANDKQTRLEGAEINKSLLALKECIRGLDEGKKHIQFRGSKLTEVLRDSFVGNSRTMMIATVSPSSVNAEHTLNTLRYAFRVKGLSFDCPMPSKERNAPRPRSEASRPTWRPRTAESRRS